MFFVIELKYGMAKAADSKMMFISVEYLITKKSFIFFKIIDK